jgi:hypothetical protein
VAVLPQPGCLTRDALAAATSVTRRGRHCNKSGRLYDTDGRLCSKHGRRCNTDSRCPIDPLSTTCSRAQVVELVNPQPNPSQINREPAEGGGGEGGGGGHTSVFLRAPSSGLPATG